MEVFRNDAKIKRYTRISQAASFIGLAILGYGLYLSFQGDPEMYTIQIVTLLFGIIMWQIALAFSNTFVRSPRPDEQLDEALKAATYKSYMYHYILPVNHVLLTRSGPVAFIVKNQSGKISVKGSEKHDRWKRSSFNWKRILGQEPALGNPTTEALGAINEIVKLLKQQSPEVDEVPIGAMVVFTGPKGDTTLDVDDARFPTMHVSELKKYLKKQLGRPLPPEQFRRLRAVFDEAAAKVITPENSEK